MSRKVGIITKNSKEIEGNTNVSRNVVEVTGDCKESAANIEVVGDVPLVTGETAVNTDVSCPAAVVILTSEKTAENTDGSGQVQMVTDKLYNCTASINVIQKTDVVLWNSIWCHPWR